MLTMVIAGILKVLRIYADAAKLVPNYKVTMNYMHVRAFDWKWSVYVDRLKATKNFYDILEQEPPNVLATRKMLKDFECLEQLLLMFLNDDTDALVDALK